MDSQYADFPPLQPPTPPDWFSPSEAQYMSEAQWQLYYAHLTGYLLGALSQISWGKIDGLRMRAGKGLLGGPNDGGFGQGWAWK